MPRLGKAPNACDVVGLAEAPNSLHSRGMRTLRLAFVFAIFPGLLVADEAENTRRVRAHATFLADDAMEGRATGTRGYVLAANYVAAQFARIGLEPGAGDGRYLQAVKMVEVTANREASGFVIRRDGTEDVLQAVAEMRVAPAAGQAETSVTAPAVYVGYGIHAPHLGHDDLAGVDLQGKIAVLLSLAPETFPGDDYAHFSRNEEKFETLARHGAVGVVVISAPRQAARQPWSIGSGTAARPNTFVYDGRGGIVEEVPQLQARAALNPAVAQRLFVAAPKTAAEAFAATERNEFGSVPLNVELSLSGRAESKPLECANVLGWLPGSDPALADEPIVVTGHLDHLGLRPNAEDRVMNGAADNAVGIGILLAVAEELAAGPRLRRPVLFAALTAEERRFLGAFHLAHQPPPQVRRYAANVNLDMPLFMVPVRDVVAYGAEHSTLGAVVRRAADKTGFTVSADWMPEQRVFTRSDQYAFICQGVPALMLGTGTKALDPTVDLAAKWQEFLTTRYHRANDDLNQPIDWPSAGAHARFSAEVIRGIANDVVAPSWLLGNYFGERFGKR